MRAAEAVAEAVCSGGKTETDVVERLVELGAHMVGPIFIADRSAVCIGQGMPAAADVLIAVGARLFDTQAATAVGARTGQGGSGFICAHVTDIPIDGGLERRDAGTAQVLQIARAGGASAPLQHLDGVLMKMARKGGSASGDFPV